MIKLIEIFLLFLKNIVKNILKYSDEVNYLELISDPEYNIEKGLITYLFPEKCPSWLTFEKSRNDSMILEKGTYLIHYHFDAEWEWSKSPFRRGDFLDMGIIIGNVHNIFGRRIPLVGFGENCNLKFETSTSTSSDFPIKVSTMFRCTYFSNDVSDYEFLKVKLKIVKIS